MKESYILLKDAKASMEWAEKLGKYLKAGDFICLYGDLGAGKTHFAKGIAKGLGITEDIVSPTFLLVQEYSGPIDLLHFDVYRIEEVEELLAIGYEDYLKRDAVILVEWANRIESLLPPERLDCYLAYAEQGRILHVEAKGDYYERLLERVDL